MKKILLICLCLLSYLSLFAQRTINGKVTDSSGETLIGATVIQKGTSNGVITNIDGIFTISLLPNVPEIIQVSMIGYKKAELNLQKQGTSLLNVVLTEDNVNLDEVVVVGYGTQKKHPSQGLSAMWEIKN
ncbi:carboxypeptidase-like regulatory domain-containing protein [Bacteroides salyersiae]|uniref:carboxypeptidase-like regulatory domain-containing protein n=1 Tax=Bacteroides salyersiae TaxID=291644 RepID=UPI002166143D|nr:carboxypeptidase-like regulatory domain-containing protein [Bacteroides salyersiae]MCS3057990.1 carboxypeptidase-like regulatory domain-containing protein [Bacteroides salyersiae]